MRLYGSLCIEIRTSSGVTCHIHVVGSRAVPCVPVIVAVRPWQSGGEGGSEVEDGVCNDHVVVDTHHTADADHSIPQACESYDILHPYCYISLVGRAEDFTVM